MSGTNARYKGFTIVELLIVVVVIAILAAITIIAYNGVTYRARQTVMQSNVRQLATQVQAYYALNGAFPAALGELNGGQGVPTDETYRYAYTPNASDFCLTISSLDSSDLFHIVGSSGPVQPGACAGHEAVLAGFPTRGGYTDISTSPGITNDTLLVEIGSIPTGAWMIVVLSYTNAADPVPPAGWAALAARKTTGTMQTIIYAKVKEAGDDSSQEFNAAGTSGYATTTGALLWGEHAAPMSSWVLGSYGDRANNATSTTVVTPTVTVADPNSLVLSIATERTAATEVDYVSLAGVSPWIWIPQVDSMKMQTIAIGYVEQGTPGVSQAMTVTYPNGQSSNGTGVQLVIPPAS